MKQGSVIFLNGTSSAGKSTLSWAIQEQSDAEYYWLSNDAFTDMPHNKYYEKDWRATFHTAISMMYKTVRLYTEHGLNVIIDHVLLDDAHGNQELAECLELMRGIPVTFVFVKCPLEELKKREAARGDRDIGNAESQFPRLFPDQLYDIVVDTFACPISECASTVIREHEKRLRDEGAKTAFAQLAEKYGKGVPS